MPSKVSEAKAIETAPQSARPESDQIPRISEKLKPQAKGAVVRIRGNEAEKEQKSAKQHEVGVHDFCKRLNGRSGDLVGATRAGRCCHAGPRHSFGRLDLKKSLYFVANFVRFPSVASRWING